MAYDPEVRAEQARQLLDNELFKEAFAQVEAGLVKALKQSAIGDVDTHHTVSISLQLLESLRRHIEAVIRDGEVEKARRKDSKRLSLFRGQS